MHIDKKDNVKIEVEKMETIVLYKKKKNLKIKKQIKKKKLKLKLKKKIKRQK